MHWPGRMRCYNCYMSFDAVRFRFKERPYLWAYVMGTGVLTICSVLWWFTVFLGTQHVFWSMIDNSLATASVVVQTKQARGNDSLEQLVHIDTGAAHKARSLTILKQGGTEVKTEILATKDVDYTRYLSINSNEKADTSKIRNVWAKSDNTQQSATQSSGHQLYAQSILGIGLPLGSVPVPVGAMPPDQLYRSIREQNVYKPDFHTVKKERRNGRLLYTYDVKIQTLLYISMMKDFARNLGLHELDSADPNSFSSTPIMTASLTVDAYSHQLAAVNFKSLGYSQTYGSYGLPLKVELPKSTISSAELQKRVTEATQSKQ
jgi:hypothetical protein